MWKGKYSERLVHKKMLQLSDEYTIFNNLLFESNGRSTGSILSYTLLCRIRVFGYRQSG